MDAPYYIGPLVMTTFNSPIKFDFNSNLIFFDFIRMDKVYYFQYVHLTAWFNFKLSYFELMSIHLFYHFIITILCNII